MGSVCSSANSAVLMYYAASDCLLFIVEVSSIFYENCLFSIDLTYKTRSVKLTTHLHLVPRLKMRGAIHALPQYSFMTWCLVKAQGQLYFTFL